MQTVTAAVKLKDAYKKSYDKPRQTGLLLRQT